MKAIWGIKIWKLFLGGAPAPPPDLPIYVGEAPTPSNIPPHLKSASGLPIKQPINKEAGGPLKMFSIVLGLGVATVLSDLLAPSTGPGPAWQRTRCTHSKTAVAPKPIVLIRKPNTKNTFGVPMDQDPFLMLKKLRNTRLSKPSLTPPPSSKTH